MYRLHGVNIAIVERMTARRFSMSAFGTKRTSRPAQPMSAFGGKADIKLTRKRLEPVKEKRAGARPDCGGASAEFLEARPPARHVDRRQHIAFAKTRFSSVPFIFGKLGGAVVTLFFRALERSAS